MGHPVDRSTLILDKSKLEVLSLRDEALQEERDVNKCPESKTIECVKFKFKVNSSVK